MVDWKKEIKLSDLVGGAKKKEKETPELAEALESTPRAEQTSIWKKEISFKRKPKGQPAPVEPEQEQEPEPEADVAAAAVERVNAYARPVVEPKPAPKPEAEPVAEEAQTIQFPTAAPDPEVAARVVDMLASAAPAQPDPPQIDLSFPAQVEAPAAPAAAADPVEPAPVAAPVVVHPPVPAAQLPPLPDEEQPKRRKNKKEKNKASKPDSGHVPFYRRELSFGRKTKSGAAAPKLEEAEAPKPKPKRARPSLSFSLPRPHPRGRGGKGTKRIVGLKLGASQLAAATVSNNGHSEVVQVARQALEPGVILSGELREPDLLTEALREFFKVNKLPKRGVRLGIATNRIGVRTLEISGIEDQKQLANAIRFRAQEALPIPIDEAVLDYQVLSESRNEEGELVRKILLVLAYRDLIDRYVDACKRAGLQLVGIDLEAFALLRALAAPREEETPAQAALVAVTVGHDRTTFAVSDGRVCEFTRVLDWGGQTLNVALARTLDRAPSEVDVLKRELSLDANEVPEGLSAEQAQSAREALRRQVQSFARELVSSLQFYQNQPGSLGIGEIVLTGGTAHLRGFAEELERLIGVRVRIGDPLVRVKVGKKVRDPEQVGSFAVAIGLGIED